ncbi:MAG: alpha/beta hydrolase [Hyphomonadaceae bacterium]|nr:alpha/beta hydrolase [Hyphomonadaceae bacterium]
MAAQSSDASKAGLEKKTVSLDGYDVHYYEGGEGPVLVLLHGMSDEKNSFVKTAGALTATHRVILPDLKGHGENERRAGLDYSIGGQVDYMDAFAKALGLSAFSIGGNSMGGHISVAYAARYPGKVENLIIVNAPGLVLDDNEPYSGFEKRLESRDDLDAMLSGVVVNRPSIPGPIADFMIKRLNDDFDFLNEMARQIRDGRDYALNDVVAGIPAPALILWGRHDEIVKFNVAEAYSSQIKNAELKIFENASHSPQLEIADEVGGAILEFLQP